MQEGASQQRIREQDSAKWMDKKSLLRESHVQSCFFNIHSGVPKNVCITFVHILTFQC